MSPGDQESARGRWSSPEFLLALLLAVLMAASTLEMTRRTVGIDYYLFWVVGEAQRQGELGDVYAHGEELRVGRLYLARAEDQARQRGGAQPTRRLQAARVRSQLENYSTPFLYTVFGALVSGDFERDLERFQVASLLAYFGGLVLLGRALGHSPTGALLACAFFSLPCGPFVDDLSVGNVNRAQVGLIGVVAWLLARRSRAWSTPLAGLVFGALVAFKPNLAYAGVALLAAWLWTGKVRDLARFAAGSAAALALALAASWAWFGELAVWSRWAAKLPGLMPTWATAEGNQSLARLLHDRLGLALGGVLPWLFLGLACAAFGAARRARAPSPADAREPDGRLAILALALGAAASVLSVKLVWQHYHLLLVPLALALLRPAARPWMRSAAALGAALLSVDVARRLVPAAHFDPVLCLALGASSLFALGLAEAWRLAGSGPPQPRSADAAG